MTVGTALIGVGVGAAGVVLLSNVATVPEFAPTIGDHDRHRCGHRLRSVHNHPLPGMGTGGGLSPERGHRGRARLGRPGGDLRGRHRGGVAAGPAADRPAVRGRAGPGCGHHRDCRDGRVGDPAAGRDRPARRPDHHDPLPGSGWPPRWWRLPCSASAPASGCCWWVCPWPRSCWWPGHSRPRSNPLRRVVRHREPKPRRETGWYRLSRMVQSRPWLFAVGGTVVLLVLAAPVLGLRLGFSDEGNFAEETTTRQGLRPDLGGLRAGGQRPVDRGRRRHLPIPSSIEIEALKRTVGQP